MRSRRPPSLRDWRWKDLLLLAALVTMFSSGMMKGTAVQRVLPIDLTLLALILLAALATDRLTRFRFPWGATWPVWAFGAYFAVNLIITPQTNGYALSESLKFIALTLPATAMYATLVTSSRNLMISNLAWLGSACIAVALASLTPVGEVAAENERLAIGDSAGTLGYFAATGLVVTFGLLVAEKSPLRLSVTFGLVVLSTLLFAPATIGSASRGAIVGLAAAVAFLALASSGGGRVRLLLLVVVVGIPAFVFAWARLGAIARSRMVLRDESREWIWDRSMQNFLENPWFGSGMSNAYEAVQPIEHPHNILLEVASAEGALGLVVLGATLLVALVRVFRARQTPGVLTAGALFCFFFMGSLVSLNVNNRTFWFSLAAALVVGAGDLTRSKRPSATREVWAFDDQPSGA